MHAIYSPRTANGLPLIALALLLIGSIGCGGAGPLSQKDMMALAIKRTPDKEPADDAVANTPAARIPDDDWEQAAAANSGGDDVDDRQHPAFDVEESADVEEAELADSAVELPLELSDPAQLLERSRWNLEQIGAAITKYSNKHRMFPKQAIHDGSNRPLLSWRVQILPYLGYHSLYKKFRLDEPWNSNHNLPLVQEVPPVYSVGLPDGKTTYLAPLTTTSVLGTPRGLRLDGVEDGLEHTLIAVDCADPLAVPWTRPLDVEVAAVDVARIFSDRRFVLWANGMVGQMRPNVHLGMLHAFINCDDGQPYTSWEACVFKGDEQTTNRYAALGAPAPAGATPGFDAANRVAASRGEAFNEKGFGKADLKGGLSVGDAPVPETQERELALAKYRSLFGERYLQAKSRLERLELARTLLEQSNSLTPASVDRFVCLELTTQIAAAAGDIDLASQAVSALQQTFATDLYEPHLATLQAYLKSPEKSQRQAALGRALGLVDHALSTDEYGAAERLLDVAASLAGPNQSGVIGVQIRQRRNVVNARSARYARVRQALQTLGTDPNNEPANRSVGSWFCFVREEWDEGLPLLSRCGDVRLQELAKVDLESNDDAYAQLELADRWWKYAATQRDDAPAIRQRAAHWYALAAPRLDGLEKLKAEMQLKEFRRLAGVEYPQRGVEDR